VQGVIEDALETMHHHPVALTGSGRTDSGVHAAGQAAHFHTDIDSIEPGRFAPALNGLLPPDARVLEAGEAPAGFHARFDARARTYRYFFVCARRALPHESRYALQLWRRPRVDLLNAYCRLLIGERDCSLFAAAGDVGASAACVSRSRHISRAAFFVEGPHLVFEISANAFLWKMVRSVAGTLLHYEERGAPPELLRDIIASGRRELAGPTLPPHGLFLWKVEYYR
jgi:tRNA pseudouridine38-40 synthase